MPARDPAASLHIPSAGKRSRRSSIQQPNSAPRHSGEASHHWPASFSSSNDAASFTAASRVRQERNQTGSTTTKPRRRSLWPGFGSEGTSNSPRDSVDESVFDQSGDTEGTADSSPPQSSSAIRERTLTLAASLVSESFASSSRFNNSVLAHSASGGSQSSDDDFEDEQGEPRGRAFGRTRLATIMDSRTDLVDANRRARLDANASPDKLGSPASGPSALSMMLSRSNRSGSGHLARSVSDPRKVSGTSSKTEISPVSSQATPRPTPFKPLPPSSESESVRSVSPLGDDRVEPSSTSDQDHLQLPDPNDRRLSQVSEDTPLLDNAFPTPSKVPKPRSSSRSDGVAPRRSYAATSNVEYDATDDHLRPEGVSAPLRGIRQLTHTIRSQLHETVTVIKKSTWKDVGRAVFLDPVACIPAVVLGLMLNILDGVSYGMIT